LLGTVQARDLFVGALGLIRERYGFWLCGYVVMPEHVHLLISESVTATPSLVLKALKHRVSRDLPKPAGEKFSRVWQARFYDFNVHSAWKRQEKLDYMHFNPVKRGLVQSPGDWAWSSFLFYAKKELGLVPIDRAD
jgi:putative transposase